MTRAALPRQHMPDWLANISAETMASDPIPIGSILDGSFYYPASGFDEDPVAYFGGNFHSFVYVDYGMKREDFSKALEGTGFAGYRLLRKRNVPLEQLVANGDVRRFKPSLEPEATNYVQDGFCEWAVLEREPISTDQQGPSRISLLFICADGVPSYDALYVSNRVVPEAVAIIQPGGNTYFNPYDFEDENDDFARCVFNHPCGLPKFLLFGGAGGDHHYLKIWPHYSQLIDFIGWREETNKTIGIWGIGTTLTN